jgi:hydrogenase expression/formation protein HypC
MCLAIPGKVISIDSEADPTLRTAKVDFGGVRKEVSLAFTPDANPGDYVLVHVGFALSVVNEEEARKIFDELSKLEQLSEDLGPDTPAVGDKTPEGA